MKTKLFCKVTRLIAIVIACQVLSIGSIWAEPIGEQEAGGAPIEKIAQSGENHVCDWSTCKDLGIAVGTSMTAAIVTLLLFFGILRPRLKIMPKISYQDEKNKKGKPIKICQIAIKNKGIIHCNDIRVEISKHILSEYNEEIRVPLEKMQYLSIAGRLADENKSSINVEFVIEPDVKYQKEGNAELYFPRRVIVEVLAQNALSGIIAPTCEIFNTDNFSVGKYVNTTFVGQGDTYKQAMMKPNFNRLKKVCTWVGILWSAITACLYLAQFSPSFPLSVVETTYISLLSFIFGALAIVIWQIINYTKAEAYNINNLAHIVKNTIVELHAHKYVVSEKHEVLGRKGVVPIDVEADQEDKEDKTDK